MKITIEFNSVEEYLEFKEKTAQEEQVQEQSLDINEVVNELNSYFSQRSLDKAVFK